MRPNKPVFETLLNKWSYVTSKIICDAIHTHGFDFEAAKKDFDDVALHVIEEEGGWGKMVQAKLAEPPSLRSLWAQRAYHYLENIKFPKKGT